MGERNSKIEASGRRSRGRPINSKKVPPDPHKKSGRVSLVNVPQGGMFLQYSIQDWKSLRARYNEAARAVRGNCELEKFWTSLLRQRLGLAQRPSDA
jgi:hypothetical protein